MSLKIFLAIGASQVCPIVGMALALKWLLLHYLDFNHTQQPKHQYVQWLILVEYVFLALMEMGEDHRGQKGVFPFFGTEILWI